MINLKVKYVGNSIDYLEVYGHSDYSEHGKDIVCAGVSSLLLSNLMYAEKAQLGRFKSSQDDGHVIVEVKENNEALNHLLEAIVEGITLIQEQYPKYIKIKIWR